MEHTSRNALAPYFDLLLNFDDSNHVAVDCAHNMVIVGAVLARKPEHILELGLGSGYLTKSLLHALRYNTMGSVTTVDNWLDTQGEEPEIAKEIRAMGEPCRQNFVCLAEKEFVSRAPSDFYDLLISDADHYNSHKWLDQHLRIVKDDGLLFFHDTNQPDMFPGLATLEAEIITRGLPYFHFRQNSRPDERCDRGLLFVINRKRHPKVAVRRSVSRAARGLARRVRKFILK